MVDKIKQLRESVKAIRSNDSHIIDTQCLKIVVSSKRNENFHYKFQTLNTITLINGYSTKVATRFTIKLKRVFSLHTWDAFFSPIFCFILLLASLYTQCKSIVRTQERGEYSPFFLRRNFGRWAEKTQWRERWWWRRRHCFDKQKAPGLVMGGQKKNANRSQGGFTFVRPMNFLPWHVYASP